MASKLAVNSVATIEGSTASGLLTIAPTHALFRVCILGPNLSCAAVQLFELSWFLSNCKHSIDVKSFLCLQSPPPHTHTYHNAACSSSKTGCQTCTCTSPTGCLAQDVTCATCQSGFFKNTTGGCTGWFTTICVARGLNYSCGRQCIPVAGDAVSLADRTTAELPTNWPH